MVNLTCLLFLELRELVLYREKVFEIILVVILDIDPELLQSIFSIAVFSPISDVREGVHQVGVVEAPLCILIGFGPREPNGGQVDFHHVEAPSRVLCHDPGSYIQIGLRFVFNRVEKFNVKRWGLYSQVCLAGFRIENVISIMESKTARGWKPSCPMVGFSIGETKKVFKACAMRFYWMASLGVNFDIVKFGQNFIFFNGFFLRRAQPGGHLLRCRFIHCAGR